MLTHAQNSGILQEVLTAKNTLYSSDGWKYNLTPLGFAIYEGNHAHINSILTHAQNSGILQDILANHNAVISPTGQTYSLTPLGIAIHKGNIECINSIIVRINDIPQYIYATFQPTAAINERNTRISSALDNVSISSRYVRENSKVN
ncbi:WD_0033/WD_0034 family tandem repeat-containing protein [Wolbachia endosymbiont (group B) of Euphydryas aurinia]